MSNPKEIVRDIERIAREKRTFHSKSDNIGIMIGNETDEIIQELFKCLLQKYEKNLKESMKGCKFAFDSVNLLHYNCHKISLNHGGSYTDSLKWLKNTKK